MSTALSTAIRCGIAGILSIVALATVAPLARAEFGIASLEDRATNAAGEEETQAGAHPFASTVTFTLNRTAPDAEGKFYPDENVKDLVVDLPRGFVGNPTAVPTCERVRLTGNNVTGCPADTQVGVATVSANAEGIRIPDTVPVFNMQRGAGQVANFGFSILSVPIHVVATVSGEDGYAVRTTISNISEAVAILGTKLTLWGTPGESAHDDLRSFGPYENICDQEEPSCVVSPVPAGIAPTPFLTNPTLCGGPLTTTMKADSWQRPGVWKKAAFTTPSGITGCDKLTFDPSLDVRSDTSQPSSPSGLTVDLKVPQDNYVNGLATPTLRKAVVSLPAGMTINPAAADGLGACSDEQIAIGQEVPVSCPASSKIGDVTIVSPDLSEPLAGSVFLGSQESNDPLSGKEFRVFLDAESSDYGISLRLEGGLSVDPVSGQVTATFDDNPQLPFSELTLALKGGPRAPLSTPSLCGTFTTSSQLTPWAAEAATPATPSAPLQVDADCGTPQTFAPSFTAGTTQTGAGAFSPFTVTFSRSDADQTLGGINVHTPPGLLGVLKSVAQCQEPQASEGACGAGSLIGHATVGSGIGSDPLYLGGDVYLTGPYKGAPFGLSIVVPAVAGPFNLGTVVVRAAISVDPNSAALTIASDPLPSILQGVPLDIRTVNVTVDRAGFMFNPTNCAPLTVAASIDSAAGRSADLTSRFQATDCASLAFKPKFSASVAPKSSRANGAALDVKIASGPAQANIGRVAVSLPKALPSRLSTIQKACLAATFAADPASCPAGSLVGTGTAVTPILSHALSGPAYLVSHGGAAFPDLVVVLRGEGITVDLTGAINITKAGVTSSTFNNVPDVPISSFELKLPTGPHSALTANLAAKAKGSFCGQSLTMPTAITGQNGTQFKQSTKIAITGCVTSKAKKKPGGKAARRKGVEK